MSRYIKSKTKLSKRIGRNLFLKGARSFSAKDDYTKRPQKAGMHIRKFAAKVSEYGKQLLEKQSIKFTYSITETQLANLFKKAFTLNGDTGKLVLTALERRLDNVVYRAGLANSRAQARQLVNHGHFQVNTKNVDIPSYLVASGDVINVKANKFDSGFWKEFTLQVPNELPAWLDSSKKNTIKVINLPIDSDLPQEFKIGPVVEFYSRKVR